MMDIEMFTDKMEGYLRRLDIKVTDEEIAKLYVAAVVTQEIIADYMKQLKIKESRKFDTGSEFMNELFGGLTQGREKK